MPSLTVDETLIYFAHCPKAGGTSVERFMVEHWGNRVGLLRWGWDRHWAGRGERPGEVPSSPQHYRWSDALSCLPRTPDHVFAVVREPVARLLSEYRFHCGRRLTGPFGHPLRGLPFATWLRVMLAVARDFPHAYDNHFRPQTDFMPKEGAVIFRLEDGLRAVGEWLCGVLGQTMPDAAFPHELVSVDTPGQVRPFRQDLSLIGRVYAGDFERFGYPLPTLQDAPDDPSARARERFASAIAPAIALAYRRGLV